MTLELLGKACMMVLMNTLIVRTLLGLIYGLAFGYVSRHFGLTMMEMVALMSMSIVWCILNVVVVIESNRVRSTPS